MTAARAIVIVAAALGGCQSLESIGAAAVGTGPNAEAKLRGIGGSAATGAATVRAYDGGVILTMSFAGVPPGEYRVAIHENGNCTSSNGFSAGPPWAPPGVAVVVRTVAKSDDSGTLSARLPGYRFDGPDGVFGRAVVVHAGSFGSLEARPGVPNNRVACGVIGTPTPLIPRT